MTDDQIHTRYRARIALREIEAVLKFEDVLDATIVAWLETGKRGLTELIEGHGFKAGRDSDQEGKDD